jgi:hypothetical protein
MSTVGDGLAHPAVSMIRHIPNKGGAPSSFNYTATFVSSIRGLTERT